MTRRHRVVAVLALAAAVAFRGAGLTAQSADAPAVAVPVPSPAPAARSSSTTPIVVGSKPFGESYLLAELFAQLLEARGFTVTRRFGLGGTSIIFPALRQGAIDVYPEYTGSGLLVILKAPLSPDPAAVFDTVSRQFRTRFDAHWLAPLGFENTYAMSVRTETAERLQLQTLSDAARVGGQLRAGFTADFIGLADGLPALRAAYGLTPQSVSALAPALKYQALVAGAVDLIDAYSTDGLLDRHPLTVLVDDRHVFPPYAAAALVRGVVAREQPGAVAALGELSGRLDVRRMRTLNAAVEVSGRPVADVAAEVLRDLGLVDRASAAPATARDAAAARSNAAADTPTASLPAYMWSRRAAIAAMSLRHLWLVGVSLAAAVTVGVALGLLLAGRPSAEAATRAIGVLQTVPGIALLAFMLPVVGIGAWPAILALFLYSLYPIVRGTVTGVRGADGRAVEAAVALGMTPRQVLTWVQLPLAVPIIMAGVRTAAVTNVGTATLAAFVGGGGLGDPIVAGLALADTRLILSGAIPAAVLALLVDVLLGGAERWLTPRGLRAVR